MADDVLVLGGPIPDIVLTAPDGGKIALRSFAGQPLALYFYPRSDTPGCTREAQEFGSLYPEFRALGFEVLGVSKDAPAKLCRFVEKYGLTVPLASDDADLAASAFGTWVEKQLYGKTYMGIDRATFLFDARGRLARSWRKVRVPGHAEAVLAAARELE